MGDENPSQEIKWPPDLVQLQQEIKALQKELNDQLEEIEQKLDSVQQLENNVTDLEDFKNTLERNITVEDLGKINVDEIDGLTDSVNELEDDVRDLKRDVETLQKIDVDEIEINVGDLRTELNDNVNQVVDMYLDLDVLYNLWLIKLAIGGQTRCVKMLKSLSSFNQRLRSTKLFTGKRTG